MTIQADIHSLISELDTQSDTKAEKVIQKLAGFGKPAVPFLIKAAENETAPRIRKWSLQALGAIGDHKAAPTLIRALDHQQMTIKLHAIRGLTRMKYQKAAKAISKLLNDESGGIRGNVITSLIELNDKSVVPAILPSLEDPMWYVRSAACAACGHFKITRAKPMLLLLSERDNKKAVRNAANDALKALEPAKSKAKNAKNKTA